jgi:hypothetical protein
MECNAYRILITGYIDEELSDDEKQLLKTHLQTCKSCFAYLVRAEAMKTVMKRCRLLQDVPEVPPNFAQNISATLRGIAEKEKLSFGAKVKKKYQEFVFGIIERWVGSLKTRPFAWMTSVSLLVVLVAGVVCVDIFRTVYQEKSFQYTQVAPKPTMQIAQNDEVSSVERQAIQAPAEAPAPAVAPELKEWSEAESSGLSEGEPIQYVDVTPVTTLRVAKQNGGRINEKAKQLPVLGDSSDRMMEEGEFIQVDEESFLQFAKSESTSVEDYVYSHVITVSQDQFIDDAVFVGYVQDALYP